MKDEYLVPKLIAITMAIVLLPLTLFVAMLIGLIELFKMLERL